MKTKNKKSQVAQIFLYVIAISFITLFIILGYNALTGFRAKERGTKITIVKEQLKTSIETLAHRFGSVDDENLDLPDDTEEICFLDLSRKDDILRSLIVKKYPLIRDSVQTNAKNNFFIIEEGRVTESDYVGDICLDHPPYSLCLKPKKGVKAKVLLEGRGSCTTILEDGVICKRIEMDFNNRVKKDFRLLSVDGKLEIKIPAATRADKRIDSICIRPSSEKAPAARVFVSEPYYIVPEEVRFQADSVRVSLEFYQRFLNKGITQSHVGLAFYENKEWIPAQVLSVGGGKVKGYLMHFGTIVAMVDQKPKAVIKTDKEYYTKEQIANFDGTESFDPSDTQLSYKWTFPVIEEENAEENKDVVIQGKTKVAHAFDQPGLYSVSLRVTNKAGYHDTAVKEVLVLTNNRKNMQMYQDNPLFTAANTNKHLLLKIIPLSLWQETEHINSYPFHAYRLNEDRSQPLTVEGYNFGNLMDIANSQKIYLFGKLLEPENAVLPLKVTMFEEQYLEEPTIHDNYVSFWERYDDVVIIDLGNSDKDTGIIASLYAAFLNAPLFLIDLDNIDTIPDYSLIYTDKNAYVIGDIGSNTNQYINDIKSNVNSFRHYTKAYISKIEVNPYAKLYSRIQPVTTVT